MTDTSHEKVRDGIEERQRERESERGRDAGVELHKFTYDVNSERMVKIAIVEARIHFLQTLLCPSFPFCLSEKHTNHI